MPTPRLLSGHERTCCSAGNEAIDPSVTSQRRIVALPVGPTQRPQSHAGVSWKKTKHPLAAFLEVGKMFMRRKKLRLLGDAERRAIFLGVGVMKQLTASIALAAALVAGSTFMADPANASTINYTLSGVTFGDGGTASGTFAIDSISGHLTAFDITTTTGSVIPGIVYDPTTVPSSNITYIGTNRFVLSAPVSASYAFQGLSLGFLNPLTNAATDPLVLGLAGGVSYECLNCNPVRWVTAGEAVFVPAVPIPATLPLFATGLGALGLLTWRRKRKAKAALEAA